jgi:hypothetical protein
MIMLFPTLSVPGLPHIEIFRDHEDDFQFYALRSKPRIATDEDDEPMLSYNLFSRNADIAYASSENKELIEAQLGQLLLTTDLGISKDEHDQIVEYLAKVLKSEKQKFNRFYYRFLKKNRRIQQNIDYKDKIKLSTSGTWNEGRATFEILEGLGDTFKKSSSSEVKPTLSGYNAASFYATFGLEGGEVILKALTEGFKETGSDDEVTPLQAIVRYELSGFAWVPNLEINVTAQNTQVHNFLQEYEEDYRKEKRGSYRKVVKRNWLGRVKSKKITDSRSLTVNKTEIAGIVEEMIDRKIVNMDITDFSGVGASNEEADEIERQIKTTVIDMIMTQMLPAFFETAFIADEESANAVDEEGNPIAGSSRPQPDDDLGINAGETNRPTVDTYYKFTNNEEKSKHVSIGFHFKKNGTVPFNRYPNGTPVTKLTPDERKRLIKRIDISSPEIQILQVQTSVNADFEKDNIDSIIVNLRYSQKDHKTGVVRENTKSFVYRSPDETNTFRVTMARDSENRLLDYYDVTAKINYRGTAESPPEIKLNDVSDRALVISYDKLGFVSVKANIGEVDWEVVKEIDVDFKYLAEPNKSDTRKKVKLTEERPSGDWNCYMYGHDDPTYEYTIKYFYKDGTESESETKRDTRDTLIVNDNLVGRMKASFDMIIDPESVNSAKVEVLYEDSNLGVKEEFSKWFEGSETWNWTMRLRDGGNEEFKYRYTVQYSDGLVHSSEWKTAMSDEDIPPIDLQRYKKPLMIDAGLIDWTKWKIIYVNAAFDDDENNYHHSETFRLTESNPLVTFNALAFDKKDNIFTYSLKMAGSDGSIVEKEKTEVSGGALLISEPETV